VNFAVSEARVPAWDLPTRMFHWMLVVLVVSAWISFEFSEEIGDARLKWHRWNGLAVLTLVVWRILWGVSGPTNARFSHFVRGPAAVMDYARDLVRGTPRRFLGHNPLGALMVLALLACVGAIGSLGLFAVEHNDLATGPLYRLAGNEVAKVATSWHRFLFEPVLIALVALHIVANVLYGFVKKEPLIPAMITGSKPPGVYEDVPPLAPPLSRPLLRAFLCLAAATLLVFGGILAMGGRLP